MINRGIISVLLALTSLLAITSCHRTELVYNYNPYCDVVINTDWSSLDESPTGMSLYCFPQPSGTPIVVRTNSISSVTTSLPTGEYHLALFNQDISDYESVGFRNINDYHSFEAYVSATASTWAVARADEGLVVDPAELAFSTIEGIVVTEEQTNASIEMYHESGERNLIATYDVAPAKVVKTTGIRVAVDGYIYLRSVKGTISGMSSGYNLSEQTSLDGQVTHILESWTATELSAEDNTGQITTSHKSFGLPNDITLTRVDDDWQGSLYLNVLLRDNATTIEKTYPLNNSNFVRNEEGGYDLYINLDGDDTLVLPEVEPEGSEGVFDAEVDVWGYEEEVDIYL